MKDNNGKIILAMLAGASAGVVAGILMAPETGEATRDNLKKSASKLSKDLESKLQAGIDQLSALTSGITSKVGVGGTRAVGADPEIVSTGSNTEPTSHLAGNDTGGNIHAAAGDEDSPATTTASTAKRGRGATSTNTSSADQTGTTAGL